MIKKEFFILSKKSDVTSNVLDEYIKDPDNTLIVAHNRSTINSLLIELGAQKTENVVTEYKYLDKASHKKFNKIIFYEYMFFTHKEEIYNRIHSNPPKKLMIYSTSDKEYNKELFNLIRENKSHYSFLDLILRMVRKIGPVKGFKAEEIYDLYYNFITDNTITIHDDFFESNNDDIQNNFSDPTFKTLRMELANILLNIEYSNGDISDIGNEVGIIVSKYFNENFGDKEDFISGFNHGVSLTDGTHK